MKSESLKTEINSEIGKLNAVILHTPGAEVKNMIPENTEKALYSDILNLTIAQKEYSELSGVLSKITKTFQVKDLLSDVLKDETVKQKILSEILRIEGVKLNSDFVNNLTNKELANHLIEGILTNKDNLTSYLSPEKYLLKPLHNFYFTRDASVSINNETLVSRMAKPVRYRESIIMESIFNNHSNFDTNTFNPIINDTNTKLIIEGGDVLIARDDVLIIGISNRTNSQGVDYLIKKYQDEKVHKHIIAQELPTNLESFIHLDMVFTFLDTDKCMVYKPAILNRSQLKTIHIEIDNGKVKIDEKYNLLTTLKDLGFDLNPILCGGEDDWTQRREQWHSGANFFAIAPGKVIGYARNMGTIEALNNNNFEVISAQEIIQNKKKIEDYKNCVITIAGSELSRGGGGARCMTMPISRERVNW